MKSDTLKTLIGLLIIVAVMSAAFWYGNSQQQASTNVKPTPQVSIQATPHPTPTPSPTAKTNSQLSTAVQPQPTQLAQTGATSDLLPLAALSLAGVLYLRSRCSTVPTRQQ